MDTKIQQMVIDCRPFNEVLIERFPDMKMTDVVDILSHAACILNSKGGVFTNRKLNWDNIKYCADHWADEEI